MKDIKKNVKVYDEHTNIVRHHLKATGLNRKVINLKLKFPRNVKF